MFNRDDGTPKTYKREFSVLIMFVMYFFVGFTMWALYEAGNLDGMISLVTIIVLPSFAVFASAFALDSYFRQGPSAERTPTTPRRDPIPPARNGNLPEDIRIPPENFGNGG